MSNSPTTERSENTESDLSASDIADNFSELSSSQISIDEIRERVARDFDEKFYLANNAEVAASGVSALDHYLTEGWREGRRPTPGFDPISYRHMYLDVKNADIEPFYHYLTVGQQQNRHKYFALDLDKLAVIEPYVDNEWYYDAYPDIATSNINPVIHYYYWGWKERRNPSLNFSTNEYLAKHPALRQEQRNPLYDYISSFSDSGADDFIRLPFFRSVDFSGEMNTVMRRIFDSAYYLKNNPGMGANGDPFQHFVDHGWKEGRTPNAWFNTKFYLEAYEDVRKSGMNPLLHFILVGRAEGRLVDYPYNRHGVNLAFDYWRPSGTLAIPTMRTRFDYAAMAGAAVDRSKKPRILVHWHAYHEDAVPDIARSLRNIPEPFDVVVTSSRPELREILGAALTRQDMPRLNEWRWLDCEGRGRDIAPWVVDVLPISNGYEIALHIHTKHSQEKGSLGPRWRRDLVQKLLYDPLYVEELLKLFADETVGLIYPTPYAEIEHQIVWGLNRSLAQSLAVKMLGPQALLPNSVPDFPAGMMFWYRPSAVAAFAKLGLGYADFPKEPIRDDGALGHALERTLGVVVKQSGYEVIKARPARAERRLRWATAPVISVIVPVRNAEPWISDCLESIRDQAPETPTYEIIVVENNSTDGTRKVLARYKDFANIHVASVECRGAGGARNAGMALAKGRYITFVDADDLIVRDALTTLCTEAETHKASMTCAQLRMFYPDSSIESAMPQPRMPFERVIRNSEIFAPGANYQVEPEIVNALRSQLNDFGPCAKLYLRSFLTDRGIRFDEGVNFEDNVFVYKAYAYSETICIAPKVTYLYRKPQRNAVRLTQSTSKSRNAFIDQIAALDAILSQVVAQVTNETWRRVAVEAVYAKLNQTLSQYSDWTASPAMREPTVALADAIQRLQAQ